MKNLLSYLVCLLTISSCNSDKVTPTNPCLPVSIIPCNSLYDSIAFNYSADKRPTSIAYFHSDIKEVAKRDEFIYNDKNQVIKINRYENYELPTSFFYISYDDRNLPFKIVYTYRNPINGLQDSTIKSCTHDKRGRLIYSTNKYSAFTDYNPGYRYEYNGQNNVTKVYFEQSANLDTPAREVLAMEITAYDSKPTFYAGSKELAFYYAYINQYLPNSNNWTSATISYSDIYTKVTPSLEAKPMMDYFIDSNMPRSYVMNLPENLGLFYNNATYQCNQ